MGTLLMGGLHDRAGITLHLGAEELAHFDVKVQHSLRRVRCLDCGLQIALPSTASGSKLLGQY